MARITITLKSNEVDALIILADREFRDPRDQAALIIRQELERRGLLANPEQAKSESHEVVKDAQS